MPTVKDLYEQANQVLPMGAAINGLSSPVEWSTQMIMTAITKGAPDGQLIPYGARSHLLAIASFCQQMIKWLDGEESAPVGVVDSPLCERGNIWLVSETGHNAWLRLNEPNTWLEISIRPDNYPGLNVSVIRTSDQELADHIKANFSGDWQAKKINLSGLSVNSEGYLLGCDDDN